MPKTESDKLTLAREIVAGRRNLSSQQLYDLATDLREDNQIGYSRRVLGVALPLAAPGLRNEIQIKLALSTYKDPDLPVDDRLKKAETMLRELLDRPATLTVHEHQEALGILGAVYKQRWSVYGHKDHLEKALLYYRAGYDLGIQTDFGYTAINTAFVLDLLAEVAHVGDQTADAASRVLHQEASKIRQEIVTILPGLAEQNRSLEDQWWFDCTIGEAYLGLRKFEDARTWMKKAAARNPENWRLESTVRQSAHIVRLQAKEDGIPLDRLKEAPGFPVLSDLVGGSAEAASSFFFGKVGLALSGGGFRASLYHIGVLARLAELDMLRHVEVISCVSGGSILGAYYYLEVRNLLQTKTDAQITREDYIAIVKNVEKEFVAGVQRNIRMRMMLEPGSNWKVLTSHTSTTTDRLADIYERDLYARIRDEKYGTSQRFIQDLLITPAGTPGASFDPRYQNWRRMNKVPILILNATTLNTCHAWQFTATFMGEPPVRTIDSKIDGNDRLRRMYYSDAPPQYRRIRLGQAVAASSCVPGLFDPLVLDQLYPDYVAKMVDGGVYDNQGAASLLEQDCTVLLVSDASGQTAIDKDPGRDRIGVSVRTNSVLMARGRQEQYQLLSTLLDAGLLRGVAYVHLKKDLDAEPVDWLGCPDPSTPEPKDLLTTYGIRKDIQRSLAAIRTDLDSFSDAEADALMLSGYRMMTMELQSCIKGFPVSTANPVSWRFRAIEKLAASLVSSPDLQSLQTTLDIAHYQALKPYRLSRGLRALTWIAVLVAIVGLIGLVISARDETVRLMWLLTIGAVIGGIAIVVKLLLRYVLRNPNPLWQCALAVLMIFLGAPLIWIMTRWLDPIYLRSGPRYRS